MTQGGRLTSHLKTRRDAEKRLAEYKVAVEALEKLAMLGDLAGLQVDRLRRTLAKDAAAWRDRIYLGAFPDTAHELVDTGMGRKGQIDLVVRSGGVSAPAQHVTNASALRASLVGFFLAFWEHVLNERGGLHTLLLDDPQELLDDENRERLAASLGQLVKAGAQLIVASYDPRFAGRVSRVTGVGGVEHFEVLPATLQQPVVRTVPPLPAIIERRKQFEADRSAEKPARDFADECRVFLESKLGDMFDDPAHSAWAKENPNPTLAGFLARLRSIVKRSPQGMFSAHVFRRFVEHQALVDNSPVLELMNKAHHGRRREIRASDVATCVDALTELVELVEQMNEEAYRWRRRDALPNQSDIDTPPTLRPITNGSMPSILIYPDLAAFTDHSPTGGSQDVAEPVDPKVLDGKAAFMLRRNNFGFAGQVQSRSLRRYQAQQQTDGW
ncbi:hypothetical protein NKH60_30825 [Mesorhizobium sp. M1006]|uniref:hypothetical protein n=1 Tax=Mesorhizobium sp. M1006 TaxID=2957048 RepID=UPI00333B798F